MRYVLPDAGYIVWNMITTEASKRELRVDKINCLGSLRNKK